MNQSTRGILLHTTKYSDTSVIVKIYTRECGVVSFMIKNVFSKKSRINSALLSPLALVDLTYNALNNRQIHYLKDMVLNYIPDLLFNPAKSSILLFYNELIYKLLFDAGPDPVLFDCLEEEIQLLDQDDINLSERPLRFLLKMSIVLGFFPENNFSDKNCYFSLGTCRFQSYFMDEHTEVPAVESRYLWKLMSNADDCRSDRDTRNRLLHYIVEYYKIHNEQIKNIESIDILSEVLHK